MGGDHDADHGREPHEVVGINMALEELRVRKEAAKSNENDDDATDADARLELLLRYQKAHHTKMANYMEGPETQKKLDFIHNAHDLVKNEKDPTKRQIIHDKVRDTIMEIESGKFKLMGLPEKEIILHKNFMVERQMLINKLVDETTLNKEPNPTVLAKLEHELMNMDHKIAMHMKRWFLTHHFEEL